MVQRTENVEPMDPQLLKEHEDPSCMKSRRLKLLPNRAQDCTTDGTEASLVNPRKDIELPQWK
jgi:hypothetical protein